MEKKARKGGKKGRKLGRDLIKGKSYRTRGTRLKNKLRKLRKHVEGFPMDKASANRLKSLESL